MTGHQHASWIRTVCADIGQLLDHVAQEVDADAERDMTVLLLRLSELIEQTRQSPIEGLPAPQCVDWATLEILRIVAVYAQHVRQRN
jgi:hypothetical protein